MVSFYVHVADPGFAEAPWPGAKRHGPFLTVEEAVAQATSDAAGGYATPIGIFTEAESVALEQVPLEAHERAAATVSRDVIVAASDAVRETQVKEALGRQKQDRDALSSILPAGITVDDIDQAKAGGR